jgi:hypothetical protein
MGTGRVANVAEDGTTTPHRARRPAHLPNTTVVRIRHITGDVIVPAGITLTVQAGTTLFFDAGGITVNGRLAAQGTTPRSDDPRPGRHKLGWNYIQ